VLGGDTGAFAYLETSYRAISEQLASRILGDPVEAEDVVQEAMFRAYNGLARLADPSRFDAWLLSIVRNLALDHLRRRQRRNEVPTDAATLADLAGADPVGDPDLELAQGDPEAVQSNPALDGVLSGLSPTLAVVVRLRVENGLTIERIADRLDVPVGTVKRRLYDARKRIRRSRMKTFDSAAAWAVVDAAASDIDALPAGVKEDILGVAVGGDLVRGDFIPNNSNLLIFPLMSNRNTLCVYDTPAYEAITSIFDKRCKPYYDCAQALSVWENMTTDEIHLPVTAASFDPPTVPQPAWYSMFLWDLIDHHKTIYGADFVKGLYRPNPKEFSLRMVAEAQRVLRTRAGAATRPPVGFESVAHWQALKTIRILQMHFHDGDPTLAWQGTLERYRKDVPPFQSKGFGDTVWTEEMARRYPADRREFSSDHAAKCVRFVEEAGDLLRTHASALH